MGESMIPLMLYGGSKLKKLNILSPYYPRVKIFFSLNIAFIILKRSVFDSRFQRNRQKLNWTTQCREMNKTLTKFDGLVWIAKFFYVSAYFFGLGGPILFSS